jgi:hypothetical protein
MGQQVDAAGYMPQSLWGNPYGMPGWSRWIDRELAAALRAY